MRLIAELAVKFQLVPVLNRIKTAWQIEPDSVQWVDDIKTANFRIYEDKANGTYRRVILPVEPGTIFAYSYGKHADDTVNFAGAAVMDGNKSTEGDRLSVIIFGNESQEVLELRFVHEILHAMELPADNLVKYAPRFMWWLELWLFMFQRNRGKMPEHDPSWQRKYYRWLLNQRAKGVMM